MVGRQGGDDSVLDEPQRLTAGTEVVEAASPESGFVTRLDARAVGEMVHALGGHGTGRRAGVRLGKKVGDTVARGEPLGRVYAADSAAAGRAASALLAAFEIGPEPPAASPLILERIA
jgi:thymidine phosphorylase